MASDMKALEHLEEISNNLDDIRKELSAVSSALLNICLLYTSPSPRDS